MGCVVNGPGEARDADIGIAAGNKRGHLFVRGTNVAVVPEDEMVDDAGRLGRVHHGARRRAGPRARRPRKAAKAAAEADRAALLDEQGDDANDASQQRST